MKAAVLLGLCGIAVAVAASAEPAAGHRDSADQEAYRLSHEFEHAVAWLTSKAHRLIRDSKRTTTAHTNPPSIHAFPPQAGTGYEAFWLRDYEYMLEGSIDSFTEQELRNACRGG